MQSDLQRKLDAGNEKLQKDKVALQVQLSGRARPLQIDTRWIFNRLFDTNDITITVIASKKEIDAKKFIECIKASEWEEITSKKYLIVDEKETKPVELSFAHPNGFLINCSIEYRSEVENSRKSERDLMIYDIPNGEIAYLKTVEVYHHFPNSSKYDSSVYDNLVKIVEDNLTDIVRGASIGIISSDNGDYYVKNFSLEGKTPAFTFPDLHYGDGFENFHKSLLDRLGNTTKGLVLLHGEPGTGKTQYIRILLKELAKINKSILYAPPSLSSSLTEPEMIEFISDWVIEEERDCILLIEDAEPLLEARGGFDGRSTGISNLLNMTDGLLNDILGLTVIATFNINIANIDPALLRPQRLLARKEFKKMSKDQLSQLAKALDVELPDIKYPASLADFYSAKNSNHVLIHDVEDRTKTKIGFNSER